MSLEKIINDAWKIKDKITPETDKNLNHAIKEMIDGLNEGKVSIVEKQGNEWKAVSYTHLTLPTMIRV